MPVERRVERDESNAQWAHRPKGATAKRARLPHPRKRPTFGRPRVMRSKARNACNTKKAKDTNAWPSFLSELATREYPRALLSPESRYYSAIPAIASFAAAEMLLGNTRERFFRRSRDARKIALVRMALRLVPVINQHASLSVLRVFLKHALVATFHAHAHLALAHRAADALRLSG